MFDLLRSPAQLQNMAARFLAAALLLSVATGSPLKSRVATEAVLLEESVSILALGFVARPRRPFRATCGLTVASMFWYTG